MQFLHLQCSCVQTLHHEMEEKELVLKTMSKRLQNLIQSLSKEEIDQMMSVLKRDKGKLKWFQYAIKHLHVHGPMPYTRLL